MKKQRGRRVECEIYCDYDEKTRVIFDGSNCCPKQNLSNLRDVIRFPDARGNPSLGSRKISIEKQSAKMGQAASFIIKPMGTQASGEVKVEASWGDKEGTKISVGASGEISDDKGNYVKAEIKQNNDGGGSASVSAGAKKDK